MNAEATNAYTTMLKSLDFEVLTTNYVATINTVIPVVIGILAISKGIRWLKGMLYGA